MTAEEVKIPLRVGAKSHPGKVRDENQDRMSRFTTTFGEVFIVADGMGGHRGGATAAAKTIEGFEQHLRSAKATDSPRVALLQAARQTNAEIYRLATNGDPALAKMGSTVVIALLSGRQLVIGHAGDSRAYLYSDGCLQRLTRDHSAVQQMIDHGLLTDDEAREHPDSNIINRAFGQKPEIELEISLPLQLRRGDRVLLCTDGLCGYVSDAAIEGVISSQTEAQKATDELIELALKAGGEDNVTVQLLQFGAASNQEDPSLLSPNKSQDKSDQLNRRRLPLLTILLVVLAFLLGLVAGYVPGWIRAWRSNQTQAAPTTTQPEPSKNPLQNETEQKKEEPNQELPRSAEGREKEQKR
ncbi:MAG TPA: PP2C family serine/threonine-protein phosphatase [Blastocatellia bacterium]|nr:PP2C family serine/threonine-protein phosphatase [Blastocatellia bacterium]